MILRSKGVDMYVQSLRNTYVCGSDEYSQHPPFWTVYLYAGQNYTDCMSPCCSQTEKERLEVHGQPHFLVRRDTETG